MGQASSLNTNGDTLGICTSREISRATGINSSQSGGIDVTIIISVSVCFYRFGTSGDCRLLYCARGSSNIFIVRNGNRENQEKQGEFK